RRRRAGRNDLGLRPADQPGKGRRRPARPLALRRLHRGEESDRARDGRGMRGLPPRVAVRPPDRRVAPLQCGPSPGAVPGVQRLRRSHFPRADQVPAPARGRHAGRPPGPGAGGRRESGDREPLSGEDTIRTAESEQIARRSAESIAGGVVSLNRKVDPPIVFVRAQGSRMWDADGNEYLDYHAAFAPHILGHNDPGVNGAVREAMERGWSLVGSGPTPWEMKLAELIRRAVPTVESVQLANTGSEATAHAIRLSRAWTGREDILLTLGGYNGWHNDVARTVMPSLSDIGPRVSPGEYKFLPLSAGIPVDVTRRVHIVNYNDPESVEYVMKRHAIACVLMEPVLQNIGVVPPRPGYLQALRELCDRHGALLVFDEVK